MLYDFHTHSFLSDGVLGPMELIRRAWAHGYNAIAVTDHVGPGNMEIVLPQVIRDCEVCRRSWGIQAIPGVELTHVPADAIAQLAHAAKQLGAKIVVVHGETIMEPVEPGTNLAAVTCPHVDILAHPGLLTLEEAGLAAQNNVYLEISARKGHSLTNGHVFKMGRAAGAKFLVDSDSHEPGDLLTEEFARKVALGAGLSDDELKEVLETNPQDLLRRIESAGL